MGGGKVSPAAALTGGFVEPPVYGTGTGSTGTIKVAFDPLYPQKPTNWFLDGNPTAVGAVPGSKSLLALGGHHVQFQCTDGSTKFPASPGQLVSLSNNNEPATVKIHY